MTFDVEQAHCTRIEYEWQRWHEVFCVCRNYRLSIVFIISMGVDTDQEVQAALEEDGAISKAGFSLNEQCPAGGQATSYFNHI